MSFDIIETYSLDLVKESYNSNCIPGTAPKFGIYSLVGDGSETII